MFDKISGKIPEDLMRIAFITYEFPPDTGKGGIGTYVKQAATAMSGIGWDVQVFTGSPLRSGIEMLDEYCVHRIQCDNSTSFRNKVLRIFAEEHDALPFDVIESPEIGGNAWIIKMKYPELPLIVRLHAPNYLVESLKKKYIPFFAKLRFVLGAIKRVKWDLGYWRKYKKETDPDYQFIQLANFITAPSSAMKSWVVKYWKINPEKISVIPNIFFPPKNLLSIPIHQNTVYKRVVFFGRLNALKGLVNAAVAMKRILLEYPDWQFRVIGDDGNGPSVGITMRNWMKNKMEPVLKQVEFIDGLDYDVLPSKIADAEIVLLPSLFESFSYTCAEAMAAGKAIVGSKSGGMRDLLKQGYSGQLIDPGSSSDIYAAIKKLIDNNNLRYNLSYNARENILAGFNSNELANEFAKYYSSVLLIKNEN